MVDEGIALWFKVGNEIYPFRICIAKLFLKCVEVSFNL